MSSPLQDPKLKALASHTIRKLQGANRPELTTGFFRSLSQRSLPTPAEASDNLLLWIAEQADGRPGKLIPINYDDNALLGLVGVVDQQDIKWIVDGLKSGRFLDGSSGLNTHTGTLTGSGRRRVEELKRAHVASKFAFFARQFDNPSMMKWKRKNPTKCGHGRS